MNWRDRLEEIILATTKHCYAGPLIKQEWAGDVGAAKDYIEDYVEGLLKKMFQAGHRQGALAAIEVLPDNFKDAYQFDDDIDKHWSEKAWQRFRKDGLEELEV